MWRDSRTRLRLRQDDRHTKAPSPRCTETSTKTITRKSAVVISDISHYGRAEAAGLVSSRHSEKQAQLSLVALSGTIRPNLTHKPPIYRIKERCQPFLLTGA